MTDEKAQSQYINMFKEAGIDAVLLTHPIDSPFISHVEQKNENVRFMRIDTDLDSAFKEEIKDEDKDSLQKMTDELTELFRKVLKRTSLRSRWKSSKILPWPR